MKFLFTVLLISLTILEGKAQDDFIVFHDLTGRFEIAAPGNFKYSEKSIVTPVGMVMNESLSLEKAKDHPNSLYAVNIITYPEEVFDFDSLEVLEEVLLNSVEDIAMKNKSSIIYKEISYDPQGLPMVVYRLMDKKKIQSIKGILKLLPDQMYGAQVYAPTERSLNELGDKFLDSFKIFLPK